MERLKFLVLTPPQDIEIKILSLRSLFFAQYGYISALVLPVMVPLFSIHHEIPGKVLKKTLKESFHFTGFTITASQLVDISGSLFIKLEESRALSDLTAECNRLLVPLSRVQDYTRKNPGFVCFPLYRGFFLARNEQGISTKEMNVSIPDPKTLTFSKFSISLLNLAVHSGLDRWWENIDWEITFQVKSKKTTYNKKAFTD